MLCVLKRPASHLHAVQIVAGEDVSADQCPVVIRKTVDPIEQARRPPIVHDGFVVQVIHVDEETAARLSRNVLSTITGRLPAT